MASDRTLLLVEDPRLPWSWCSPPAFGRLVLGFLALAVAGVVTGAVLVATTPVAVVEAGEERRGMVASLRAAALDPGGTLDARMTVAATGAASPKVIVAARIVTGLAKIYVAIPLLLIVGGTVWWRTGRRSALWVPALAVGGGLALSLVVKLVVTRPRPPVEVAVVDALGPAYPSGHAIRAVALYGAFAWLVAATTRSRSRRIGAWSLALLLVAAVGVARVYEGAHWPTDIVASYVLGGGWLAVIALATPRAQDASRSAAAAAVKRSG